VAAMGAPRVLVVTTEVPDESRLRERLRAEIPEGAEVRVVAPATNVSALDWLTNAEDDARAEAREVAERTAEAVGDGADVAVDPTSQNTDAAEDVRDAIRLFSPDEIVVVADDDTWLEEEAVREAFAASGAKVRRIEP
jgi:hypothetical protein